MPVVINGTSGITTPNSVTEQTPSTTTGSYYYWNNGTNNVAAIAGYSDSTTAGHMEFYTTTGGALTEWARIPATGGFQINSSGGGSVLLSPASTASAYTLTVPAKTGTISTTGFSVAMSIVFGG